MQVLTNEAALNVELAVSMVDLVDSEDEECIYKWRKGGAAALQGIVDLGSMIRITKPAFFKIVEFEK